MIRHTCAERSLFVGEHTINGPIRTIELVCRQSPGWIWQVTEFGLADRNVFWFVQYIFLKYFRIFKIVSRQVLKTGGPTVLQSWVFGPPCARNTTKRDSLTFNHGPLVKIPLKFNTPTGNILDTHDLQPKLDCSEGGDVFAVIIIMRRLDGLLWTNTY